ncbi:serine hydrolase [Erythrobacter sp.]|uniref:serine hydrolase n=1 Tax=Erythrobacter sp. TaxID=1042 RepID=UPI0025F8BE18|nr:serine hydrolase [Erythrobacter sp.]
MSRLMTACSWAKYVHFSEALAEAVVKRPREVLNRLKRQRLSFGIPKDACADIRKIVLAIRKGGVDVTSDLIEDISSPLRVSQYPDSARREAGMMRFIVSLAALGCLLFLPSACSAQDDRAGPAQANATAEPREILERYHAAGVLNGTVLLAQGDKIVYAANHGVADPENNALAPDAKFRIASLTKQFTAATVLLLMEQGRLSLGDPVTRHLRYYEPAAGSRITIGQLLTHTSGIARTAGRREGRVVNRVTDIEPSIRLIMEDPLASEPGEAYEYSNANYWILGAIIEETTGLDYPDAVQSILLEPLGLDDTHLPRGDDAVDGLVSGMRATAFGFELEPYLGEHGAPWAAGMVVSTARDLSRWNRLLHGGKVFAEPATYKLMIAPAAPFSKSDVFGKVAPAAGLFVAQSGGGRRMIFHDGHIDGFTAELRYYPQSEVTTVVLDNGSGNVTAIGSALAALAHGEPVPEPEKPAWRKVVDAISIWEVTELPAAAKELTEAELNWLGYAFISVGRPAVAVHLFEQGVERFARSANMHDSYGEALWYAGRDVQAILAYRRALEIDPALASAQAAIARIEAGERPD